jgi:hypothetical protein
MQQMRSSPAAGRVEAQLSKRFGLAGWWLDLTAPPRPGGSVSLAERERIRKAELTSYSILAVFALLVILVSYTLTQPSARLAIIAMAVGLCIAAVLNRYGWTRTAAYLVPSLLMALIMVAILMAPGGLSYPWLITYDLLAIPIFLSSITLDRRAPWVLAPIALAFVLWDFATQRHSIINIPGVTNFDHIAYTQVTVGWWGMVNRHVALIFFAAFFSWLGARSVEQAIARADRAEEIARLEETLAQAETQRTEQLNVFIQELIDAFVAQANGVEQYLQLPADHPMSSTMHFLNQRLKRLREVGQDEAWRARQLQAAARLLDERLTQIATGAQPLTALHPSSFRTNIPPVDRLAAIFYKILEQQSGGKNLSRPAPSGPMGQTPSGQVGSGSQSSPFPPYPRSTD